MSTTDRAQHATATPEQLGIGMRFSLHPHCDDFVDVILGALADAQAAGLTDGLVMNTDEVGTYVGAVAEPAEQRLMAFLAAVIRAASHRTGGGHVVAHVLLSRGCPGEVTCDLAVTGLPTPASLELAHTGVPATAQWSLYPLLDGESKTGAHMDYIEAAIAEAETRHTAATPLHYATKLTGDVAEVLTTAANAWGRVGARVAHTVSHVTISVGSPTLKSQD